MSKVDEILEKWGMTRLNWECDPSFVADLINALDETPVAEVEPRKGPPWDWATDKNLADCCGQSSFRLKARADANRNFSIGWPFAESLIALLDECERRFDMNNGEGKK